ncbi:hypothetical protein EJB05_38133, partial [Eragrostis curvula]
MMMNQAAANACGGEHPDIVAPGNPVPLPPTPSLFLPVMDQLESRSFLRSEQHNSSDNMEATVDPGLHAPASNAVADYTSHYVHDHDTIQFYPHAPPYLAVGNPYSTYLPTLQEYYFPTLLDEDMASFGTAPHAQLGLNYGGYRTCYFPQRGGYAYGHHPPRCQVDGCMADLSKAKRYHRRHRVCENHSKAPVVITAGAIMPQRFCQQCSRFHEVDEFDDEKKSCRQRLADHNRRRRKPKPSGTDHVALKRRAHAKKSATAKNEASSSKNMGAGDVLGTQELGSASKEHDGSISLGEVAREPVYPKGKAPMKQHACACVPQQNLQQGFPLMLSPAGSGTGTCLPQNQQVSGGNTSQVQEPCLAFHQQHQHGNIILQLGQTAFDLDFNH